MTPADAAPTAKKPKVKKTAKRKSAAKTAKKKAAPAAKAKAKTKAPAKKKVAKRSAPMKSCPACGAQNHARKGSCDACGAAFPAKKRAKKKARRQTSVAGQSSSASDRVSINTLVAAKKLAEKLGGIDKARAALEALAKLS